MKDKKKEYIKTIIAGSEQDKLKIAEQIAEMAATATKDCIILTPEEAKEKGINLKELPPPIKSVSLITPRPFDVSVFTPPETRRDRRARERKALKKKK